MAFFFGALLFQGFIFFVVISWPLSGHFFLGRQKDTEPFIGRTARHPGAIMTEADRDDPAAMLVLGHLSRVIFCWKEGIRKRKLETAVCLKTLWLLFFSKSKSHLDQIPRNHPQICNSASSASALLQFSRCNGVSEGNIFPPKKNNTKSADKPNLQSLKPSFLGFFWWRWLASWPESKSKMRKNLSKDPRSVGFSNFPRHWWILESSKICMYIYIEICNKRS